MTSTHHLPVTAAPSVKRHQWVLTPLLVYAASRLLVFLGTVVAAASTQSTDPLSWFTLVWDGIHYVDIAQYGYPEQLTIVDGEAATSLHAFFPLYPLTVRFVAAITPLDVIGSSLLLSTTCGAIAAVLLWKLAERITSAEVATGALLFFCFFPGSFVLGWAFSESLMLALTLGSAHYLLSGRIWPAAALCALATATRPNAIVFVLCFAWLAINALREKQGIRAAIERVAGGALGATGFLSFHLYLWAHTGEPLAWFRVQREGFGEGVRPGHRTLDVLLNEFLPNMRTPAPLFTVFLVVIGLSLALTLMTTRVVPDWMRIYGLVILTLALTSNTGPGSPRLQLVAFPAFIAAAQILRGELRSITLAASSMFLIVLVIAYGNPGVPPFYMWAP